MKDKDEDKPGPPPATVRQFFAASGRSLEAPATIGDVVHAFEAVGVFTIPDPEKSGTGELAIVRGESAPAAAPVDPDAELKAQIAALQAKLGQPA